MKNLDYSAFLTIQCDNDVCKGIVKRAREIVGVTNAFRVERTKPSDADVIINLNAENEEQILHAKNVISRMEGIRSIDFKIGRAMSH